MVIFDKDDISFINKNLSKQQCDAIQKADNYKKVLDILFEWITHTDDCWEDNGEHYNDLGRKAQQVYDNIYLNNK